MKRLYLRFGKIPKSGRSGISEGYRTMVRARTGTDLPEHELGVSVYNITFEKGFIIPDAYGGIEGFYELMEDAHARGRSRSPIYLVTGKRARASVWSSRDNKWHTIVVEGSDGEPLLRDVEIVREVSPKEIWHPEIAGDYPGSPTHAEFAALPETPRRPRR